MLMGEENLPVVGEEFFNVVSILLKTNEEEIVQKSFLSGFPGISGFDKC